jgi:RpiR family carbohydrate utilization transcriptional regulator
MAKPNREIVAPPIDGGGADSFEILKRVSRNRQELLRPVLENPSDYVLLSVRGLAERLGKNPGTTLRIVQRMGFTTYRDFQRFLQNLSVAHATPLQLMQSGNRPGSGTRSHVLQSFDQDLKNLQTIRNSVDVEGLTKVVHHVYAARKIVVMGGDQVTGLVHFLQYNLLMIRLFAIACTRAGEILHAARGVDRNDVVIAISFGRGLRQTVEGLKLARSRQAFCVGITDTFVSPIARWSDQSFIASVESPSYGGSYVAPIALLNALIVGCANYRRSRTISILKQAEQEQRTGFRWYGQL